MSYQNTNCNEMTVNNILKEMSSCFEATYAEVLANLVRKSSFKQLRRLGEQQFFNAAESSDTCEVQTQQIKRQFAEVNLLAISADNIVDTVIAEKLQTNFLSMLKEEVLKIILNLYSDQKSSQEKSKKAQPSQSVGNQRDTKKKENMKTMVDKLKKDASKYFAHNLDGICKEIIEMPLENTTNVTENSQTVLSSIKEEQSDVIDYDNFDPGNLSFDSVSSVHTSDLSSFNDEISISSDEEIGKKRKRLSLKMVEDEVIQLRVKRKKAESFKGRQVKNTRSKDSKSEISAKDSSNTEQKSLPRRIRKPNSRYNAFDIISPLKLKSLEKYTQNQSSTFTRGSQSNDSVPRKRGRPRKKV